MSSKYDFEKLLAAATTDGQREKLKAVIECGSVRKAAKKLGVSTGTIGNIVTVLSKRLEDGIADDQSKFAYEEDASAVLTLPESNKQSGVVEQPARVSARDGTSTLYDADGNVKLQWVKKDGKGNAIAETIRRAMESFKDVVEPAPFNLVPRAISGEGLLAQYTITDYHLGMFASQGESGEEWSTKIATEKIYRVIDSMVEATPHTEHAVINILGDFLHSDSQLAVTPASRHVLDQDTRYSDLISIAVRIIAYFVKRARTKATNVTLLIAQGNHDPIGSLWMQELFSYYFENDQNIAVIKSAYPFYAIEFGKTMLAYHHGDKVQFAKMAGVVPSLFPEIWGRTKFRYAHMGDKHHRRVVESLGIIVEQHQTLIANDAYSSSHGWTSEAGANVIIYSRETGELSRMTFR
jgi:hypothetical protein|nr:MAG TPA: DNA polymerase II small subunit [Bacteriophage sp.]